MTTKLPPSRARRSKAEIETEFKQIQESFDREKEEQTPKSLEVQRLYESEIKQAVEGVTAESVVQRVGMLELEISRALRELSGKLLGETKLLQSIKESVGFEKKELERLHQMDVAKASLDQLLEEHTQKKAEVEKDLETLRTQWNAEQIERQQEQKQYEETLKKQRDREREEYEYQKKLERKKEQDQYEQARLEQERKNNEIQETFEKDIATREGALKEREEELVKLRKEVAEFPVRLAKDIEKAVSEKTKELEINHRQQVVLSQKGAEAEQRVAELRIRSLEETVQRQFAEIKSLGERLEEAKRQVQDIAVKAIEGASGARALAHVNQIAMEQAKTRTTPSS